MVEKSNVAIIIVNWNGYQDTIDCIKNLSKLKFDNYKLFLVDNCSTNNSYAKLEIFLNENNLKFETELIESKINLGFAGGNNIAIKKAKRENFNYFWLLNNDTVVHPNSLTALLEVIRNNRVGITGSKILYYKSKIIWFAGGIYNRYSGCTRHIGYKRIDDGKYNSIKEVDFITGCSLLIKKDVIDSIGYLNENYFMYFEDTDYCLRAKRQGWRIMFVPNSIIEHKVSMSSGGEKNSLPFISYYYIRNQYMITLLNSNKFHILAFISIMILAIKKLLKIFIENQNEKHKRITFIMRGILDAIRYKSNFENVNK